MNATIVVDEAVGSAGALPTWLLVVIAVVAVLLVIALIWALVVWWRRRKLQAPTGPGIAAQLRDIWQPFYNYLPRRALHYPTIVVVGEAGVGKTHAISQHVDWRGQANQFAHNVAQEGLMQLYLGPDVIVHELSAPLLRDVGRAAKRGLEHLWLNMGPSATVVVVLDARTLTTTPAAALRDLAQLVRGKIGLFPRRCQAALELRVCLAHLDQVDGYDEFAASVGASHGPLELGLLGPEYADANRLVAAYDGHLAYALTKRTGDEFDRMVRFYGILPELLTHLRPLLAALNGKDEPYGARHRLDGLYLGAMVPATHVGNPFRVVREQIATSIDHQNRRGLRGGLLTAVGGLLITGLFFATHLVRIAKAEAALHDFEQKFADDPTRDPRGTEDLNACKVSAGPLFVRESESKAAAGVTGAVSAMRRSENPWLRRTFVARKQMIEGEFEATIRNVYLYPLIPGGDRIRLLYVMALIYASHDNDLGRVVVENKVLWARELGLSAWVIEYYVEVSDDDFSGFNVPLCAASAGGAEWSEYLVELRGALDREIVSGERLTELAEIPALRSQHEYAVLGQVRELLAEDAAFPVFYRNDLVERSLDRWSEQEYATLERLSALLREQLVAETADTSGWGLAELVKALSRPPLEITEQFELEVDGKPLKIEGEQLAGLLMRSRAHILIDQTLTGLDDRIRVGERRRDGRAFFATSFNPPKAGVVKGYGGGPRATIQGFYTRPVFEDRVTPVLEFASQRLRPQLAAERAENPDTDAAKLRRTLTDEDARTLDSEIMSVAESYAIEYRAELFDYYQSFELNPSSEMTLPFIFKAFVQPSSWFTEFLSTVSYHATPTLPDDDSYFVAMKEALADFGPLVDLLVEDKGVIAGLEPYQKLLADLQVALNDEGSATVAGAPELRPRLSAIGQLMLDVLQESRDDHDAQVRLWLLEAGLDTQWHDPFRAPVREAQVLGIQNIQWELAYAWTQEVRPLVRPLLQKYPFNPVAGSETSAEEIESIARRQGKEPGEFWLAFDRLLGPVTIQNDGEIALLRRLKPPPGMLTLIHDLERMTRTLWDPDGARLPLNVVIKLLALPKEAYEERTAALAYVRSAGGSVYGFNQRPEAQTLELQWWNQDSSVVSLEMRADQGGDTRSYNLALDGPFSFYRLLDLAANPKAADKRATLTETAINAATRCYPGDPSGTKNLTIYWRVPVDDVARTVRAVLVSDPWAVFAVRDCGW